MLDFLHEIIHIFKSDHPFLEAVHGLWDAVLYIWDYKIFETSDKHKIHVGNIVLGIVLFILGSVLVRKVTSSLRVKLSKILPEKGKINALEKLAYYFFMILVVIFVLDISNVPITVFTVIGTTLAVGVGLGSQNIVNNFISGIIIMIEQPVRVGDIIEIKGVVGAVVNIGARCTSLKTTRNINMLIPNSNILQDSIINWTLEDDVLKDHLELVLESDKNISEIDEVLFQVLSAHGQILKTPEAKIVVQGLCRYGYSIMIEFWVDISNSNTTYIKNDLNRMLSSVLKENNILIIDSNLSYYKNIESVTK